MIKSPEYLEKADALIKPIYAATVLGIIEWVDALDLFYTKEEFDGFSFQIGNGEFELFINGGDNPSPFLSFKYGDNGERLVEYLRGKREKAYIEKFAEALEALTNFLESAAQHRKELQ